MDEIITGFDFVKFLQCHVFLKNENMEKSHLVVCGLAFPFEYVSCQRETQKYTLQTADFFGSTIDFSEFDFDALILMLLHFYCALLI